MKTRRIIYLVLGCILVLFNLVACVNYFFNPAAEITVPPEHKGDIPYVIGHFIGLNLFLIIGVILLYASYRIGRKLARKKKQEIIDSF
jgi:hypothetical protein